MVFEIGPFPATIFKFCGNTEKVLHFVSLKRGANLGRSCLVSFSAHKNRSIFDILLSANLAEKQDSPSLLVK